MRPVSLHGHGPGIRPLGLASVPSPPAARCPPSGPQPQVRGGQAGRSRVPRRESISPAVSSRPLLPPRQHRPPARAAENASRAQPSGAGVSLLSAELCVLRGAARAGRRPDLGDLGVIPLSWKASVSARYRVRRGVAVLRPSLAPSLYRAHFPARFRFVSSSGDDAHPQLRGLSHSAPRDPRSPVRWGRPLAPPCYPGGARTSAASSHLALQVTVVRRTLVFVVVVIG